MPLHIVVLGQTVDRTTVWRTLLPLYRVVVGLFAVYGFILYTAGAGQPASFWYDASWTFGS